MKTVPPKWKLLELLKITIAEMERLWEETGQLEATGQTWREYGETHQPEEPSRGA